MNQQTLNKFNDIIEQDKQINIPFGFQYCEKNTDYLTMSFYSDLFQDLFYYKRFYYTAKFKTNKSDDDKSNHVLIPDGYDVLIKNGSINYTFDNSVLVLIENKRDIKQLDEAKIQILKYLDSTNFKKYILIIGTGTTKETFKTFIYINNRCEKENTISELKDYIKSIYPINNKIFNVHRLNQIFYDNNINIGNYNEKIIKIFVLLHYTFIKSKQDILKQLEYIIFDEFKIIIKSLLSLNEFTLKNFKSSEFEFYKLLIKYFIINYNNTEYFQNNIINELFNEIVNFSISENAHSQLNKCGCVITPEDITKLMFQSFKCVKNETNNDNIIFYDSCAGIGNLEFELLNQLVNNKLKLDEKQLIVVLNEKDINRFNILKIYINFYKLKLNNININVKFKIINSDAFDKSLNVLKNKCDYIIINPPYLKTNSEDYEYDFIKDSLIKLKHNGILTCIIRQSRLKEPKFQKILNHFKILNIIELNDKVFMPMASVKTCIINIKKCKNTNTNFNIINYKNDGYDLLKIGKIQRRIKNYKSNYSTFKIKNLNELFKFKTIKDVNIDVNELKNFIINYNVNLIQNNINEQIEIEFNDVLNCENINSNLKKSSIKSDNLAYKLNQELYDNVFLKLETPNNQMINTFTHIKILLFVFKQLLIKHNINLNNYDKNYLKYLLTDLCKYNKFIKTQIDVIFNFPLFDEMLKIGFKEEYDNITFESFFMNLMYWTNNKFVKGKINTYSELMNIQLSSSDIDSSNGIVYTNKLIVENINNDVFEYYSKVNNKYKINDINYLDFCAGSGSFPIDAIIRFKPKNIFSIEISNLTSIICLMVSLNYSNFKCYNDNCFKVDYKKLTKSGQFDIICINPPYSGNVGISNELFNKFKLDKVSIAGFFVLFGLTLLKDNGILGCVIPLSYLRNEKFLNEINKLQCKIIKIVNYTRQMFQESNINVDVCHIIIKKINGNINKCDDKILCVDFDSGYDLKFRKTLKYYEPKFLNERYIIKPSEALTNKTILNDEFMNELIIQIKQSLKHQDINIDVIKDKLKFDNEKFEKIKLCSIFKIIPTKIRYADQSAHGKYPLIGGKRNGETARISTFDVDISDGKEYYTIACITGGYIQKQIVNFSCSRAAFALQKIKLDFDDIINIPLINLQLSKVFNWRNGISKSNFNDIEIWIYNEDKNIINKLNNHIKQINDLKLNELNLQIANIKQFTNNFKFVNSNFKKIKLCSIFKLLNRKIRYANKQKPGKYPLIGGKRNGETINIDSFDIDVSDGKEYYTIACITGGFIQKQTINFSCSRAAFPMVKIYESLNDMINLPLISFQLSKCFNWSNGITKSNFNDIEVYIYAI